MSNLRESSHYPPEIEMSTAALERAKALSAAESRAIEQIQSGVPLPEVLDELCRSVDRLMPALVSTVLLMDPDGKRLWPGGAPGFPLAVKPALNPWVIGPNRGACGTSAFIKEQVIIADVTTDSRFPEEYRTLAVRHGLRASWSQPLISGKTVLGTFALYFPEPRVPDAADLELLERASQIALRVIQLERSAKSKREEQEKGEGEHVRFKYPTFPRREHEATHGADVVARAVLSANLQP